MQPNQPQREQGISFRDLARIFARHPPAQPHYHYALLLAVVHRERDAAHHLGIALMLDPKLIITANDEPQFATGMFRDVVRIALQAEGLL